MTYDKLIYGKNDKERIVGVEPCDAFTTLFIENEDGTISEEVVTNRFWLLCNKPLDRSWVKLKGNLFYQYGKQFKTRDEFLKTRNQHRDKQLFSIYDPKEAFLVNFGYTYFKGMKHNEVSVLSFDIESTSLEHTRDAKVLIISNTYRKNGKLERKMFCYDEYEDEGVMIDAWCDWVRECNPAIILGHNIYTYDLPYLNFIAERYGTSLKLGRDGSSLWFEKRESKFRREGGQYLDYYKPHIYGRELSDTYFLAIKHDIGRNYESYGLKKIIAHEGLEVKDRQHYDAANIRHVYKDPGEWEKIKRYAEFDADDALALFDLMGPSFFYGAQSIPKSFQQIGESASGSQINATMCRAYLQEGHSLPQASQAVEFEGAISDSNPGIYTNLFKVDAKSMYPSIMIQYNIFDKNKDPKEYFIKIVTYFTEQRLLNKQKAQDTGNKYYSDLEQLAKVQINSMYGFMGTAGLLFNSPQNAALVTEHGRRIINIAIEWATSKGFQIANIDTDSISFTDRGRDIPPEERNALLKDLNSLYPSRIVFADDGYFKKAIIVKTKNYLLWDGKKIKYKGNSLKASQKSPALKQFIKDILDSILEDRTDFTNIYNRYVREINNLSDMSRWVDRKTVSEAVMTSTRLNETKIKDAIQGSEYVQGDRVYLFSKNDDTLDLLENFNGDYSKTNLLNKLFDTSQVFETVLDTKTLFPNYTLKKNQQLLQDVLNGLG